jgi:hypothetical protein
MGERHFHFLDSPGGVSQGLTQIVLFKIRIETP